jgi:hypothetical protein
VHIGLVVHAPIVKQDPADADAFTPSVRRHDATTASARPVRHDKGFTANE